MEFIVTFRDGRNTVKWREQGATADEAAESARRYMQHQYRDADALELVSVEPAPPLVTKGKLRATRQVEALLSEALSAAELQRCGVKAEHQDAMRLYLDTWVAGRLREALSLMRGEVEPWQVHEHYGVRA